MKVRAIGRFAELATPTFLTGQLFFLNFLFGREGAVRDGQGLLARHAEVKRTMYGALFVGFNFVRFEKNRGEKNWALLALLDAS